jgi:hypothetical protein
MRYLVPANNSGAGKSHRNKDCPHIAEKFATLEQLIDSEALANRHVPYMAHFS